NTANGDWRELRDLVLQTQTGSSQAITYLLGMRQRTLAEKSSPSAAVGVAGLRGLNDGLVPVTPAAGGRGGAGRGAGAGGPAFSARVLAWEGTGGPVQWVKYTFRGRNEISKVDVFWMQPPQSWRVLYQDGGEWKPVVAKGAYGLTANAFTSA